MKHNIPARILCFTILCTLVSIKTAAESGDTVLEVKSEQADFRVISVAEGLDFAWDVAFLPDGGLLLSEYDGRLHYLPRNAVERRVIDAIPDTTERGGLRGIAPHRDFLSNRLVYFCYATGTSDENHTRISRAQFDGQTVSKFEVVFDARNSAHELAHYGCRLLWLEDGTLLATLGDRLHFPGEAQALNNNYGTIIRINDDGSTPEDNPYVGTAEIRHEIWAYGLRNVQGADSHPKTGDIWVSDHGPYGGDEINIIRPGRNYGWPIVTFGIDYDGTILTDTSMRPDVEAPLFYWYPSIAPSSVAFYTGDDFLKWRGDLFVGSLAKRRLFRLELHGNTVIGVEELLVDLDARIRDVTMGPDGKLYVLTDTGDGRLLRLEPTDPGDDAT